MNAVPVDGRCEPAFLPVYEAFVRNMTEETAVGREVGACVSVVVDGRCVVDLWGGWRDHARVRPWQADTIVCMMSVGKAAGALCVLLLADRGRIDLDAPVADVWPEFAQAGKEAITVRTVLAQLAGLPCADAAPAGSLWRPGAVVRALEVQRPEWAPGTTPCYHSFTAGPLYGEIVRRVDGRTLGRFFREEIAAPFGIDYNFGLTPQEDARVAPIATVAGTPTLQGMGNPASLLARAWRPLPDAGDFNTRAWRRNEFASGNGHGNARAMARLYGCLARGGEIDGLRLIGDDTLADAAAERWDGIEAMTSRHFRFGTGFQLTCPAFRMGPNANNFGHAGLGGAVAFADPDRRLGFSYCGNRLAPVADRGPFAGALIDALYSVM